MDAYILTVVIPTYNTEAYLSRCVNSLLHPDINGKVQIIIVNDGSKDNSLVTALALAEEYSFIEVIDKANGGHGSTINRGVGIAKGKYFRVLDSDDWYETDAFVKLVNQLDQLNSDLVVTWGYYDRVYENKQLPYVMFEDDSFIEYGLEYKIGEFDFHDKYLVMAHISYRTNMLQMNYHPLLENTFYVDNEFLLYPMINVETVTFLNLKIYHYFIGRSEQSMSKDALKRNISHIEKVSIAIAKFIEKHDKSTIGSPYLLNVATRVSKMYYSYLLAYFPFNRIWVYVLLKKYDELFQTISPIIYNELDKFIYIKYYRKMPFFIVFISPFLYLMKSKFKKLNIF